MAVTWWKDLTSSYLVREKGPGYTPCSVAAGSSLFLTARPAPRPDLTERLNTRFLRDIMSLPYYDKKYGLRASARVRRDAFILGTGRAMPRYGGVEAEVSMTFLSSFLTQRAHQQRTPHSPRNTPSKAFIRSRTPDQTFSTR